MKKWIICFLGILLVFGLSACTSSNVNTQEAVIDNQPQENNSNKILIVYFSMPETSSSTDMSSEEENSTVVIDNEVMGNTQYFASIIQEYTQGTLFRIEPTTPYLTSHELLIDLASTEQKEEARPLIKNSIDNFEQYDIVFVGYPNWWGDMPMILYTFFDDYDFESKTIIPFNTHGGSGFSNTIETIKELEPAAIVSNQGLSISRNEIENSKSTITSRLDALAKN
ncbi:flavodoxin [Anaerorhabdus furcosa]|uniref:Flavodoxin n=1 Tax=Anaerorhabdus furcosa TaxID=118967 RepID=A0A1T4MCR1_9FIRM|nr:flavodoxin [Anaerorhabdus furcosa]SJZ64661.1 Flavodoxin [Anaerorhabdus furcosa]